MMHRGWSNYVDELRDDIWKNHPQIHVVDFNIYSMDIFNHCENSNDILMVTENWKDVHPMLKVIPVEWKYTIPYGILYSPEPSKLVKRFLKAIQKEKQTNLLIFIGKGSNVDPHFFQAIIQSALLTINTVTNVLSRFD